MDLLEKMFNANAVACRNDGTIGILGTVQLGCEDIHNEEVRSLHDRICQRLRTNGDGRCSYSASSEIDF